MRRNLKQVRWKQSSLIRLHEAVEEPHNLLNRTAHYLVIGKGPGIESPGPFYSLGLARLPYRHIKPPRVNILGQRKIEVIADQRCNFLL